MNPICPHCKNELSFTKTTKLGNPFLFKCPICKEQIKNFDLKLIFVGCVLIIALSVNTIWIINQIENEKFVGAIIAFLVLAVCFVGSEYFTHKYLAKYGALRNDKPNKNLNRDK